MRDAATLPVGAAYQPKPSRRSQPGAAASFSVGNSSRFRFTIADFVGKDRHFRKVPILLQKSFWGVERKFLEPLMRFALGDVRDHVGGSKIDHGPA